MDPYNVTWYQGADLVFSFTYKEGPVDSEVAINLTGYSLRMDIVVPTTGEVVYTFNTNDSDPTTTDEAVLGSDGSVNITVPRAITLPPSGAVYQKLSLPTPVEVFNYDIFLRNTSNKQAKIMKGQVTIERSYTLWS